MTIMTELTGDYVLDAANTKIGFTVGQAMIGKAHGRFDDFAGSVHLAGDDLTNSDVTLTIRAASVTTNNTRRDQHVRTKFLDAANHPTITATLSTVEQLTATRFKVSGGLTMRGVTKPVTMDVALATPTPGRITVTGQATIDRTDWNVAWSPMVEGGGVFVGKQVTLEFAMAAIRRP
jgi:polyisoprenoid-binding protein YceI